MISMQAGTKEIEEILKSVRKLAYHDYLKDDHFARHVIEPIDGIEKAYAFLAILAGDAYMADSRRGCAKARNARAMYEQRDGFWLESVGRIRSALARARRVHCGCHETGSLKPDRRWPFAPKTPKERVRAARRATFLVEGVGRFAIYDEALDPSDLLGVGQAPVAAWANADGCLRERYMNAWWAGKGDRLEPSLTHEPGLSPTLGNPTVERSTPWNA